MGQEEEGDTGWPKAFLDDFESTLWMTYRSDFKPIPRVADYSDRLTFLTSIRSHLDKAEGFTSDSGWGCMIRSGQAVIANALAHLRLGRGMRRPSWLLSKGRRAYGYCRMAKGDETRRGETVVGFVCG